MDTQLLIAQGNEYRSQNQPTEALKCYAQAFVEDMDLAAAWNNYGNVIRECGHPARGIPFLQHALALDPRHVTAQFNLAVCYLMLGDYARGWPAYECRWNYEHLAGTQPKFEQPRWTGQELRDKTILVVGEQGHGDNIQFVRFMFNLHHAGAKILFQVTDGLIPLLSGSPIIHWVGSYVDQPPEFDYWIPIMSIPGVMGVTIENLTHQVSYLSAHQDLFKIWLDRLGPKKRMRVGFCWSGRKDNWLNTHKGMPFEKMLELIKNNPTYEWINLQVDASPEEESQLAALGVTRYPGSISSFADTAALVSHMDVVLSVDTSIAHLSAALGRPTWLMLNWFAPCWRWMLNRDSSPWYSSMRIFRQPAQDDWTSVTKKIEQYLSWFKV